jgi:hypothetical protein
MEKGTRSPMTTPLPYGGDSQNDTNPRDAFGESVLTDSVLNELKEQSANGCLLCAFDAWDGEEWD